jgi:alkylated DNA repair dioxygenase AlkB
VTRALARGRNYYRDGRDAMGELGAGDLFVMGGALQAHYRHHVPRTARPSARA